MAKALPYEMRIEESVGPRLLEAFGRCVNGLMSGHEGTGCEHLNTLGLAYFCACVDYFLLRLLQLLRQLSKLSDFSLDEWII